MVDIRFRSSNAIEDSRASKSVVARLAGFRIETVLEWIVAFGGAPDSWRPRWAKIRFRPTWTSRTSRTSRFEVWEDEKGVVFWLETFGDLFPLEHDDVIRFDDVIFCNFEISSFHFSTISSIWISVKSPDQPSLWDSFLFKPNNLCSFSGFHGPINRTRTFWFWNSIKYYGSNNFQAADTTLFIWSVDPNSCSFTFSADFGPSWLAAILLPPSDGSATDDSLKTDFNVRFRWWDRPWVLFRFSDNSPACNFNQFYFRWLKYKITEIGMSHQNLDEPSKMKPSLLSETDNLSGSDWQWFESFRIVQDVDVSWTWPRGRAVEANADWLVVFRVDLFRSTTTLGSTGCWFADPDWNSGSPEITSGCTSGSLPVVSGSNSVGSLFNLSNREWDEVDFDFPRIAFFLSRRLWRVSI